MAVLKSGVHATLAGVLIAFCIPMRDGQGGSPLRALEHDLHAPVAFVILPTFAFSFVNAGLSLAGVGTSDLLHPVALGIVAGLLLGKPVGIVGFIGIAVLLRLVTLPKGMTWAQVVGVAFACGNGFTMSLFIAGLAFEHGSGDYFAGDRSAYSSDRSLPRRWPMARSKLAFHVHAGRRHLGRLALAFGTGRNWD